MTVNINKIILIFLFTTAAILIALRPEEFDPDLEHYFRFWSSGSYPVTMEPGFIFISKKLSNFFTPRSLLIIYTIFMMVTYAMCYKKPYYIEKASLAFFALLPTVFLIQIRFGLALTFFTLAMLLIKRPVSRIILMILSISMHYSMLILAVLFLLSKYIKISYLVITLLISITVFLTGLELGILVKNFAALIGFKDVRLEYYTSDIFLYQRFNFLNLCLLTSAFFMLGGASRIKYMQYIRIKNNDRYAKFLMLLISLGLVSSTISMVLNFRVAVIVGALVGLLLDDQIASSPKIKIAYRCILAAYFLYFVNIVFFSNLLRWGALY